ncbi:MAG: DUF523 domain-containing protein [Bacilli bacterium]|nr:DUF523 domain-containing protein [Bacilli bacterium]
MTKEKILVSACLAGINCKYNGKNNEHKKIIELIKNKDVILICPEQLGGLKTPRTPAERIKDKVITNDNIDVTKEYQKGAEEVLNLVKKFNIKTAILKSKSPSCGKGKIYDGTFSNTLIYGNGITTELLEKNGIKVISSDEL